MPYKNIYKISLSKKAKAFTLLEIVIIVAILGLLIFLGVNYYLEYIYNSRIVVIKNNIKLIRDALARYFKHNLKYPTDLNELIEKGYLNNSIEELLLYPLAGVGDPQIMLVVPDIDNGASENAFLATLTVTVTFPDQRKRQIKDIKIRIFNNIYQ